MYNKTIIRFGFCDIQNNQGLSKGYQPKPKAEDDNPYLDLDYSGYHKNSVACENQPLLTLYSPYSKSRGWSLSPEQNGSTPKNSESTRQNSLFLTNNNITETKKNTGTLDLFIISYFQSLQAKHLLGGCSVFWFVTKHGKLAVLVVDK